MRNKKIRDGSNLIAIVLLAAALGLAFTVIFIPAAIALALVAGGVALAGWGVSSFSSRISLHRSKPFAEKGGALAWKGLNGQGTKGN